MLEIVELEKSFGKLEVLKNISLAIPKGKITAVLGPNASGKSTLIKCVLGMVRPRRGKILLEGEPVLGKWDYRRRIGYMPQIARFPENLTVNELFSLLRDLRPEVETLDRELYERYQLDEFADRPVRVLSGGTRQKINASLAFMFVPDVFILDEPTVGMDPIASSYLKDKICQERDQGKTVILTSHIMSEVEELAEHLIFLLEGNIHFQGTLETLREETGKDSLQKAIVYLVEKNHV